ncbi:MAG TPA: phosphatase PAP2 family protein [Mycobacteriales bacterium]|nr:phosphatase PAP2 family protein [Mycobacteriales bacterium]
MLIRRLGAVCAVVGIALTIMVAVRWGPLLSLDESVTRSQTGFTDRHDHYFRAMRVVSTVFEPLTFHILGSLVAVAIAARRRLRLAGWVLLVTYGYLIGAGLKLLVRRRRPTLALEHVSGFSFPSGHAMSVTLAMIVLAVLVRRWWSVLPAVAIAGVTGWSRIALGVHYLSDVVGGAALAGLWAALLWPVLRPISFGHGRSARGSAQLEGRAG